VDELGVALQGEWVKIDMDFINAMIESMPRCVKAVSGARRGSTKYENNSYYAVYSYRIFFKSCV
jgi:hypothetical protein